MAGKLSGEAKVFVAGQHRETHPGATLDPGGEANETVNLASSVGFTSKIVQSKIECEFTFGVGDRLSDFAFSGQSVQFQTDTGQTFVIANAWTTDRPVLSAGGKVKVTIEGVPAQEMI